MGRRASERPKRVAAGNVQANAVRARGTSGPEDGRWYWQAVAHDGGTRRTIWSGWATRDEAQRAVAAVVSRGVPEAGETAAPPAGRFLRTVEDLLNVWVEREVDARSDLGDYARTNYRNAARRLLAVIGDVLLDAVNDDTLRFYRDRRKSAGSVIQRDLKVFKSAWRWAGKRGYAPRLDLEAPTVNVKPVRDRYTPTAGEVVKVLGELDRDGWAWHATFLLWATGARIGELAALRWADVNLERGEIRFHGKRTGHNPGGIREVPIGGEVVEVLQRWEAREGREGDSVWPVSAKAVTAHLGPKYLKPACERARIRRFSAHALRRAAEDRLAERGVDVADYAALLGHTPAIALQHYRRPTRATLRRAVAQARLGELVPESDHAEKVVAFPGVRAAAGGAGSAELLTDQRLQGSPETSKAPSGATEGGSRWYSQGDSGWDYNGG